MNRIRVLSRGDSARRVVARFQQRPNLFVALFYITLTLMIIGPWLRPGFILTLDMVFGPMEPTPNDEFYGFDPPVLGAKYIPESIHAVLAAVISPDWSQKVVLGLIFLAAGIGAHLLAPVRGSPAKLFAGTFYTLNPFVYARILAGQWFVLAGYAALPFAIWATVRALRSRSPKDWLVVALLLSVTAFNAQMFVLGVVSVSAVMFAWSIKHRQRSVLSGLVLLTVATLLLNLYWIVPALQSDQTVLQQIDQRDLDAFAPISQFGSAFISITGLYGFWRDGYEYPVTQSAAFYFLIIPIIWLAVFAVISKWRTPLVSALAALGIAGLVLAPGISGPFDWLFRFLFENVPFFNGFRDSHKFAVLIALTYAVLGAVGLEAILENVRMGPAIQRRVQFIAPVLLLVITAAYTYTALLGFGGRLQPVSYPDDWQQAQDVLDREAGESSILLLPWNTYMEYPWLPNEEKSARTLAKAYFSQSLIFPKSVIKRAGIFGQSSSPEQEYIRDLLNDSLLRTDFGERISELAVSHVLLVKAEEWEQFDYLNSQLSLELAFDGPSVRLYRNLVNTSRLELLTGENAEVTLKKNSSGEYRYSIVPSGETDVRFISPNGDIEGWRLDGDRPEDTSDQFSGTFVATDSGVIEYYPARNALVWILISALALISVLALTTKYPAIMKRKLLDRTKG